ncbi:MAG: hypothetical protein M3Y87_07550 [Myxococcota bacterium]|nr:hypothetical protein [Myxococcota bacterium]
MGILIAFVVALGACGLLYVLTQRRPRVRTTGELRVQLRRMTHDADVAERLLERMRRRHPSSSEAAILRLAIAELRSDRRR